MRGLAQGNKYKVEEPEGKIALKKIARICTQN